MGAARVGVKRIPRNNMKTKNALSLLLAALVWAVIGTGCNTMEGAGKDIEKAGDKIQDAADRR